MAKARVILRIRFAYIGNPWVLNPRYPKDKQYGIGKCPLATLPQSQYYFIATFHPTFITIDSPGTLEPGAQSARDSFLSVYSVPGAPRTLDSGAVKSNMLYYCF